MVTKVTKKLYKRVVEEGSISLSQAQAKIVHYLCDEFLTTTQIAKLTHTTPQNISKHIRVLKKKGVIKSVGRFGYKKGSYKENSPKDDIINKVYRYHAISFSIKILDYDDKFIKTLKQHNRIELDNNTIMLHEDYLICYLNRDFRSDNVNHCIRQSIDYVESFIVMLENHLNIVLIKPNSCFIKFFRGEMARVEDNLAKEVNIKNYDFKIYDSNGILRLIVDKSFNFNELEAVSEHHIVDSIRLKEYFLPILEEDNLLNPLEVHKLLQKQQQTILHQQEIISETSKNIYNMQVQMQSMANLLEKLLNNK